MSNVAAVRPVAPVTIAQGGIRRAPAVTAGPWLFATGHLAADEGGGFAPAVLQADLPLRGRPRAAREGAHIFAGLGALMAEAGFAPADAVRIDQYFTDWRAVDPYHRVRREFFGAHVPPSTSILVKGLLLPDAAMDVQLVARRGGAAAPPGAEPLRGPPESGTPAVARAGDLVFVTGQLARGEDGELAAKARVPRGHLWRGTQIELEAEFVIRERVAPVLAAAGASLADVVKAQIYLGDINDAAAFQQVWNAHFSGAPPAATIVPTAAPGFGLIGASLEINAIALAPGAAARRQQIEAGIFPACAGQPNAVRVGDLLFLSGLMAVEEGGLAGAARRDPRQPYYGAAVAAEMRCILAAAERICAAAGTSLANLVRVQQFHTDLADFDAAYRVWREALGDRPLPFSGIAVPGPLPVPGARVLLDLWVYAP